MKGILKWSVWLGEYLRLGMRMQAYFICYLVRGGVVFGFFPALATLSRMLYQEILKQPAVNMKAEFKRYYWQHFKESNLLGYCFLGIGFFLWLDLQISKQLIGNPIIHMGLLGLFLLVIGTAGYLFPVFTRYNLSFLGYIKQSVIVFFTNIGITLAIFLSTLLIFFLCIALPFLALTVSIPLIVFPSIWWGLQACQKSESKVAVL